MSRAPQGQTRSIRTLNRCFAAAVALLAVACGKPDDTGPTTTGTPTPTGSTPPTETGTHPLVPDEFAYTWDTDGCTTLDGASGVNVYWYAQGEADESGVLTMTEQWFWFMGAGDWSQDCVDTFEVVGEYDPFDYAALNCSECEEGYQVTRTLVDSTCGVSYGSTFGYGDEVPDEEVYVSIEMFDTATSGGTPNWQNVMLVIHADPSPPDQLSTWVVNPDFALGHAFPVGDPGYPSTYDWVGEACYTIN